MVFFLFITGEILRHLVVEPPPHFHCLPSKLALSPETFRRIERAVTLSHQRGARKLMGLFVLPHSRPSLSEPFDGPSRKSAQGTVHTRPEMDNGLARHSWIHAEHSAVCGWHWCNPALAGNTGADRGPAGIALWLPWLGYRGRHLLEMADIHFCSSLLQPV